MLGSIRRDGARIVQDAQVIAALAAWPAATIACLLLARDDRLAFGLPVAAGAALAVVPPLRDRRGSLAVVAGVLVATLLALELAIRLTTFGPSAILRPAAYSPYPGVAALVEPIDDPALGFRLRPGLSTRYQGRELRVNGAGFRGPDFDERAPAGVLRIAAFGSSITMGAGVDEEDAYAAAAARTLGARGRPAEALNFGTPGYSVPQIFTLAERMALRFRPDVVVLEVLPSALVGGTGGEAARVAAIAAARAPDAPISVVERYSFAATAIYPPANLRQTLDRLLRRTAPPAGEAADLETDLRRLVTLGRREGFAVVALLARPMTAFDDPSAESRARQRLRDLAAATGAIPADTVPLFGGTLVEDFVIFPGDLHPNARAHARFGTAVADAITAGR